MNLISQLPIWARLLFAEMIPSTYFYSPSNRRHINEVTVTYIERIGDTIWISFNLIWSRKNEFQILNYIWPAVKPGTEIQHPKSYSMQRVSPDEFIQKLKDAPYGSTYKWADRTREMFLEINGSDTIFMVPTDSLPGDELDKFFHEFNYELSRLESLRHEWIESLWT